MNSSDIWAIGDPVVLAVPVGPAGPADPTEGADPIIKAGPAGRVDLMAIATSDSGT